MNLPNIVDLMDREIPASRSWIEPKILPHSSIMIEAASPKAGKSFFALELARSLATGTTPFGLTSFSVPESAKVMLLDYELSEESLKERAMSVLKGEQRDLLRQNFRYLSKDTKKFNLPSIQFSDPEGFNHLYDLVERNRPNILIVDPVRRSLGAYDESSNADIGKLFLKLDKLIHDFSEDHLSIILVHHNKKAPATQYRADWDELEADNMSGAGRFFGDVDTLLTLAREEEDHYTISGRKWWKVKARWKTRHTEDPKDMVFSVNEHDDNRVRFVATIGTPTPPVKAPQGPKLAPKTLVGVPQKLMFQAPS